MSDRRALPEGKAVAIGALVSERLPQLHLEQVPVVVGLVDDDLGERKSREMVAADAIPEAAERPRITRTGSCGPVISSTTTNGSASVPEPVALTILKPPSSSLKVMPDDDSGAAAAPPLCAATASIQANSEGLIHARICDYSPMAGHGKAAICPRPTSDDRGRPSASAGLARLGQALALLLDHLGRRLGDELLVAELAVDLVGLASRAFAMSFVAARAPWRHR